MEIMLKNVRLAFPEVFKAKDFDNDGDPKFSATFIMGKDHPALKEVSKVIKQVADDKWGDEAKEVLEDLKADNRICLQDGRRKRKYDGFADNLFIASSNAKKPTVIDRDKTPLTAQDGRPYAGCYVNAIIDIWAMDKPKFGKRICASLSGVQFFRDGDAFGGGRVASSDDFDDLGVDEDAVEMDDADDIAGIL